MNKLSRILLAVTIFISLGGKPLIDMMVYDTIIFLTEQSEEEETVHKNVYSDIKAIKRITITESVSKDDELIHNFQITFLSSLFRGYVDPQPPELV